MYGVGLSRPDFVPLSAELRGTSENDGEFTLSETKGFPLGPVHSALRNELSIQDAFRTSLNRDSKEIVPGE